MASDAVSTGGLEAVAAESTSLGQRADEMRARVEKEFGSPRPNPDEAWPAIWQLLSEAKTLSTSSSDIFTRARSAIDAETKDIYMEDLQVAAIVDLYSLFVNWLAPPLVHLFSKVIVALGGDELTVSKLLRDKTKWLNMKEMTAEIANGIRPDSFKFKPAPGGTSLAPMQWEGLVADRYREEHVPEQQKAAGHVAEVTKAVPPSIESATNALQAFYIAFMLFFLRSLVELLKWLGVLLVNLSGWVKAVRAWVKTREVAEKAVAEKAVTPQEKMTWRQRLQQMAQQIRDAAAEIYRLGKLFIGMLGRWLRKLLIILVAIKWVFQNIDKVLGGLKDYWLIAGATIAAAVTHNAAVDKIKEQGSELHRLARRQSPAFGGGWPDPRTVFGNRVPVYTKTPLPGGRTRLDVNVDGRNLEIQEAP